MQRKLNYGLTYDEDEEEDEETLQLRLEALEAKLKLKKLQAKKARQASASSGVEPENEGDRLSAKASSVLSSLWDGVQVHRDLPRSKSSNSLQVPLSPERKRIVAEEQRSPGRIALGIDKGLKGKNVSLRRAPIQKSSGSADGDPFTSIPRPQTSFSDTSSRASTVIPGAGQKTFSERIAETRQQDKDLKEHQRNVAKLRRHRSTGFGLPQAELDSLKAASEANTKETRATNVQVERGFSRDEVLKAASRAPSGLVSRANTVSGVRNSRRQDSASSELSIEPRERPKSSASSRPRTPLLDSRTKPLSDVPAQDAEPPPRSSSNDVGLYEPFSSTHLSRRILPHSFLTRTLEDKKPVIISKLLRDIKAPDFSLPSDIEASDFVVFATIASKSSPLSHKDARVNPPSSTVTSFDEAAASENNARGKYIVFTLTDLKWTLDLYLFTTAYTRFWKLTPGTVIAILNPDIMPPKPGQTDTGRWSLVLNSSDDTILEIGTARDLGWCKATKKDGKPCGSWVNNTKTEYCEWHVDKGVEKHRRGRMEVQGMSAPFAPGGKKGGRTGFFGGSVRRKRGDVEDENGNGNGLLKEGRQYDRGTRSTFFIAPSLGMRGESAARLMDTDENGIRGANREEALRKRLAEREKERDIGKRLAEIGNGTGADYLRLRQGGEQRNGHNQGVANGPEVDAGALGLLDNRARNVQLSPLKRKGSVKDGTVSRKKTRFVTARGIREAGRESFGGIPGGEMDSAQNMGIPDEDELDIV